MSNWEAVKIVNKYVEVSSLLNRYYGIDVLSGSPQIHCPFPDHDGDDFNRSARYYPESNSVKCYAEGRSYRAYDILRVLGLSDAAIFAQVQEFLDSHDVELDTPEKKNFEIPAYVETASTRFRKTGDFLPFMGEIDKFFDFLTSEA